MTAIHIVIGLLAAIVGLQACFIFTLKVEVESAQRNVANIYEHLRNMNKDNVAWSSEWTSSEKG